MGDAGGVHLGRRLPPPHRPEHVGERGRRRRRRRVTPASITLRSATPTGGRWRTRCGGSSTRTCRSAARPTTASARRSTSTTRTATASSSTVTGRGRSGRGRRTAGGDVLRAARPAGAARRGVSVAVVRDRWATWLLETRHGGNEAAFDEMLDQLAPIRDRVLDGAQRRGGRHRARRGVRRRPDRLRRARPGRPGRPRRSSAISRRSLLDRCDGDRRRRRALPRSSGPGRPISAGVDDASVDVVTPLARSSSTSTTATPRSESSSAYCGPAAVSRSSSRSTRSSIRARRIVGIHTT